MFDINALLQAGFEKILTAGEWVASNQPGAPLVDYRLARGVVMVSTERNTQSQDANGLQTTVRYPEIAVVQHLEHPNRRVTCDAADTELILLLAEEITRNSDQHDRKR